MLSKDVCKKCLKAAQIEWREPDETFWEDDGLIECPTGHITDTTCPPPYCGYKFEHAVGNRSAPDEKMTRLSLN